MGNQHLILITEVGVAEASLCLLCILLSISVGGSLASAHRPLASFNIMSIVEF